ncbi:pilin [Patescibacteria group bacterium]|nr:pilin [Patescibacteria group bacterium]MBU1029297.1 pilin [Patescibacteria group bacterium]
MKKSTLKKIAVTGVSLAAVALPIVALAGAAAPDLGLEYAESIGLGSRDIRETAGSVIRAFMGLLGIVAVLLVLYGGFKWMTAGGNEEQVGEAKKIIISGVIGLIIIMSAYAIATFVVNAIINGTT